MLCLVLERLKDYFSFGEDLNAFYFYIYIFTDDDPGSIIPKHYRRVEIRYSKLGWLYLKLCCK